MCQGLRTCADVHYEVCFSILIIKIGYILSTLIILSIKYWVGYKVLVLHKNLKVTDMVH